ncbi:MAG: hypothetical protein M0R51_12650 [Clostridia bacterium]|jgi:hypothetical protein|nr:hypothetical protein [Clostridia bacterium]
MKINKLQKSEIIEDLEMIMLASGGKGRTTVAKEIFKYFVDVIMSIEQGVEG